MSATYRALDVTRDGQVATIRLVPLVDAFSLEPPADAHLELPRALEQLRGDDEVRVIVLTGARDGEFLSAAPASYYTTESAATRLGEPYALFKLGLAVVRCYQAMTETEKPIIAKVNGDAIGFGQSLMLGSDLIIAREDAVVADVHLGMGEVETSQGIAVGLPIGIVPGDGAGALLPLFMTPTQAKEYLMLSQTMTASELAAARVINRAVPAAELNRVTEDVIQRLLKRSAFALAWTKRVLNRHVAHQLNLALDAGISYEQLNLALAHRLGFAGDPTSLSKPPE